MLLNEHDTTQGLLVTVCDADIVGDTFENGDVSLTVEEDFYAEEAHQADETTVVDALARANVANIVGTRAVELAVEHGIIDETTVLDVGDTRHAQLLRF
jgi:hypothetical protein